MADAEPAPHNIKKIQEKCKKSIFWTAWYLCEFHKLSLVLHFAMAMWFQKGLAEGHRWFLCMVPRGHFKTSLLNIAYIVHTLINDPNKRVLMCMHNLDEGKKKARKIKYILQGRAMRLYFPALVPPPDARRNTWTATEFSVNRTLESPEASVTIAGVKSGITGGHYDIIIVDDGVDIKAANSAAEMIGAVEFLETLDPLFEDENSILLIIGTLWPGGEAGYYEQLLENEDYYKMVLGCYCDDRWYNFLDSMGLKLPKDDEEYIDERVLKANRELAWEEGQPIFPERRTMAGLKKTLRQMKSYKFAHQMLNVLLDEGIRRFRREDFLPYTRSHGPDGKPLAIYINGVAYPYSLGFVTVAMDPTGGLNKNSNDAGVTAFWWLPAMRFGCLLDYWREDHPNPMEQISALLDMGVKWDARLLIPEAGAMQVWVGAWLKQEMMRRHIYIKIEPFTPGGQSKGRRLLDRFHPFVADHQVYVLYPEHEEVVSHLVSLNISPDGTIMGDSPALADTLPMHVDWWHYQEDDQHYSSTHIRDEEDDGYSSSGNVEPMPVRYGLVRGGGR